MGRRDELLDKAVAGSITQAEAAELRSLIQKEDMDARLKALIALGVGAAAGATLPKLLELDILGDLLGGGPEVLEVEPAEQPKAGAPAHRVPLGTEQFEPENPEEEALEVAREATGLEQVGARPMYMPPGAVGDRQPRRRRAARQR